jgi:hypothetical protein
MPTFANSMMLLGGIRTCLGVPIDDLPLAFFVSRKGSHMGYVKYLFGHDQATERMAWIWSKRRALATFGESWWRVICGIAFGRLARTRM